VCVCVCVRVRACVYLCGCEVKERGEGVACEATFSSAPCS
jgi:hypothetical protein